MPTDREMRLKFTVVSDEAKKNIQELSGAHGELMRSARELAAQFPEAAAALRLFAGPMGQIFVAIEVFNQFKEAIDAVNKSLDEQIQKNSDPIFLEGIKAQKEALADATRAAALYADAIAHVTNVVEQMAEAEVVAARTAKLAAETRAETVTAAAAVEFAKLKALRDQDLIDEEQYQQAKLNIQIAGMKAKAAAEEQAKQAEIDAQQEQLRQEQERAQRFAQAIPADEKLVGSENARVKRDEAHIASLQEYLARLDKEASEKEAKAAEVTSNWSRTFFGSVFDIDYQSSGLKRPEYEAAMKDEADRARSRAGSVQALITRLSGGLGGEKTQADVDAQDLKRLQDENKTLLENMPKLVASLDANTQALNALKSGNSTKIGSAEMAGLLGTPYGELIFGAESAADIVSKGGRVTQNMAQTMITLVSILEGHAVTMQQAVDYLERMDRSADGLKRQVSDLERRTTYIGSNPGNP